MKRQLIIGLVLVLLIGVCFGTYFGIDHYQTQKEKKAAEEAAALQLSSFTSDDVTKLVLPQRIWALRMKSSWRPTVCLIRFPSPTTQTMRTNRSRHSTLENRTPQTPVFI